jgi:hypothetical protein
VVGKPQFGRYLQPEPMLSKWPGVVEFSARHGHDTPAYSYAFNNPIANSDEDGLYGTKCCNYYAKRCSEAGGSYYCTAAQFVCKTVQNKDTTPNSSDCMRKCLQDYDQNTCKSDPKKQNPDVTSQHGYCALKCSSNPENNPFTGAPQADDPPGCL